MGHPTSPSPATGAPFTNLDEMPDFVRADVESTACALLSRHHEQDERREERIAPQRPMFEWAIGREPMPDPEYLFARAQAYRDSFPYPSDAPTAHEMMEEVLSLVARFSR